MLAAGFDELPWVPGTQATCDVVATSGGCKTYNGASVPEIAGRVPSLREGRQAGATEATTELTRFDAESEDCVAAFALVLPRSEAAPSSKIENLTASARAIFRAELGMRWS